MAPNLPPPFIRQMQTILGAEWPQFEVALQAAPPVSIRLNTARVSQQVDQANWFGHRSSGKSPGTAGGLNMAPVPWQPMAYYLSERPSFTLDPLFHAGAYYVQEASSMFVGEAVRQTVDLSQNLRVLDMCAAPGGKSTLLLNLLSEGSLLVSNETIRARTASLRENLERWGYPNVAVTSAESEEFEALEDWFDIVLVDAPCSGEGLFRKDPDAVREWSLPQVELCSARQKRILSAAVTTLAPGGVLLYSTCTYNSQENDANVDWLLREFPLEQVALKIPDDWGIAHTAKGGYQFYPHRLHGEGFFLSVFRKKSGLAQKPPAVPASFRSLKPLSKALIPVAEKWLKKGVAARFFQTPAGEVLALPAGLEDAFLALDKVLKHKWFGVNIGTFKGNDFVPDHALALSSWVSSDLPRAVLREEQALLFLKKETFEPQEDWPKGWVLASYQGYSLGWMKILPNRINNYLPQERRIRMSLG
ncbi:MAG: rRNA cytosine-C5-methyltransferase [Saprospiraceae bacterium]|nr:rRNA cytosine-C5-methyltransferase [Saprospiraceae bacterium]